MKVVYLKVVEGLNNFKINELDNFETEYYEQDIIEIDYDSFKLEYNIRDNNWKAIHDETTIELDCELNKKESLKLFDYIMCKEELENLEKSIKELI